MDYSIDLDQLLEAAGLSWKGGTKIRIEGLSYDSRLVKKGDLFFAMKGVHSDAHFFLEEVAKKGARFALLERDVKAPLPALVTPSMPEAMSKISNKFFREPSRTVPVIGVTGTNGK